MKAGASFCDLVQASANTFLHDRDLHSDARFERKLGRCLDCECPMRVTQMEINRFRDERKFLEIDRAPDKPTTRPAAIDHPPRLDRD